jgi:anti-sigma factor RsiW
MTTLHTLFQASQDEFFAVLDARFSAIDARMQECEAQLDAVASLSDSLAARSLALASRGPAPTAWLYDVRMPNVYFPGVFEPEADDKGAKRWVGASGRIEGKLLLDRRFQYRFEVEVVDFVSSEAAASFQLSVDGRAWPWLSADGLHFSTVVAEAPNDASFDFALEVATESRPADRDVTFSFRRIAVSRLG